jgi:outer membrane protein TolC
MNLRLHAVMPRLTTALAVACMLLVAGCATSPSDGTAIANNLAREQLGLPTDIAGTGTTTGETTGPLIKDAPLTRESAVRLAVLHSPAFRALVADAQRRAALADQSAQWPNPVLTFERLVRKEAGAPPDLDIGRMLSVSLVALLMTPQRQRVAREELQVAQLQLAADLLNTVTATREAWVRAVAAEQALHYQQQILAAADASAELARRMYLGGQWSRLQRARQQSFYADAAAAVARAELTATATREALIRHLGLTPQDVAVLRLPDRLPAVPKVIAPMATAAERAWNERIDIRHAEATLRQVAAQQGVTQIDSWLTTLHVGWVRNSETGKNPQKGFEFDVSVPLFDTGNHRRAALRAEAEAATARFRQALVDAQSALREHGQALVSAHALARHYEDEVVPLHKVLADETLLKYNGMLVGVFDLLAQHRVAVGAVVQALDAQRDYWLADANFTAALLGRPSKVTLPTAGAMSGAAAAPDH